MCFAIANTRMNTGDSPYTGGGGIPTQMNGTTNINGKSQEIIIGLI